MKRENRPSRVSVVLPAYRSQATVAGCLEALGRQELGQPGWQFEVIVVDSSPDGETAREVAPFADVTLIRSPERLLPHAARNLGAGRATGDLLVFIDPDVYPHPDWLSRLVASHQREGHVVVGALACHGRRFLDQGIHLCKFSKWLPGGAPHAVDMSPTANMAIDRRTFEAVGGFDGDEFLGDALLSWELARRGVVLWFEPRAVVDHHHLSSLRGFLRERRERGVQFGEIRSRWQRHGRGRSLLYLAVSVLPVRIVRIAWRVAVHCRRAGRLGTFALTWPIVLAGHGASLLGEARAYLGRLIGGGSSPGGHDQDDAAHRLAAEHRPAGPHGAEAGHQEERQPEADPQAEPSELDHLSLPTLGHQEQLPESEQRL
jgi:glycosyltransferase involved in cell wall biosynthesis